VGMSRCDICEREAPGGVACGDCSTDHDEVEADVIAEVVAWLRREAQQAAVMRSLTATLKTEALADAALAIESGAWRKEKP